MNGVLNVKLAMLGESVDQLRRVSLMEKVKQAEHCLALALDLLGELADKVETLESTQTQHGELLKIAGQIMEEVMER